MRIFFSGIGGVGIGPLAQIASDIGHEVLGADIGESAFTRDLRERGAEISNDQTADFIQQSHSYKSIDWFVYTSSLPADHPHISAAHQLGIHISKRDELLNHIIRQAGLKLIAIAGTHGKTTTTAMMAYAMQKLGLPVSYSIGSTVSFGPSGYYEHGSEFFVYECDEYDRNFLHFSPYLSLITSLDYDHPDTYPTQEAYTAAFREFAAQSESTITWPDAAQQLGTAPMHGPVVIASEDRVTSIKLAGAHNRRNAALVLAALERLDVASMGELSGLLDDFPGTTRRFERLADHLYSDYGHHPAEIVATLQLACELSDKIAIIYQPHQNARQHQIRHDYKDAFVRAERVYWLPTYLTRENHDLPVLTPQDLTQELRNKAAVRFANLDDALWREVSDLRQQGYLVLFMGAGTIDGWLREQLQAAELGLDESPNLVL